MKLISCYKTSRYMLKKNVKTYYKRAKNMFILNIIIMHSALLYYQPGKYAIQYYNTIQRIYQTVKYNIFKSLAKYYTMVYLKIKYI